MEECKKMLGGPPVFRAIDCMRDDCSNQTVPHFSTARSGSNGFPLLDRVAAKESFFKSVLIGSQELPCNIGQLIDVRGSQGHNMPDVFLIPRRYNSVTPAC